MMNAQIQQEIVDIIVIIVGREIAVVGVGRSLGRSDEMIIKLINGKLINCTHRVKDQEFEIYQTLDKNLVIRTVNGYELVCGSKDKAKAFGWKQFHKKWEAAYGGKILT